MKTFKKERKGFMINFTGMAYVHLHEDKDGKIVLKYPKSRTHKTMSG